MCNVVGKDIQKLFQSKEKDCYKARDDKKGEILATLVQEQLDIFLDVAQSAQRSEHQSKKSKGAEDNKQVKVERSADVFKNVVGNWLDFED